MVILFPGRRPAPTPPTWSIGRAFMVSASPNCGSLTVNHFSNRNPSRPRAIAFRNSGYPGRFWVGWPWVVLPLGRVVIEMIKIIPRPEGQCDTFPLLPYCSTINYPAIICTCAAVYTLLHLMIPSNTTLPSNNYHYQNILPTAYYAPLTIHISSIIKGYNLVGLLISAACGSFAGCPKRTF